MITPDICLDTEEETWMPSTAKAAAAARYD